MEQSTELKTDVLESVLVLIDKAAICANHLSSPLYPHALQFDNLYRGLQRLRVFIEASKILETVSQKWLENFNFRVEFLLEGFYEVMNLESAENLKIEAYLCEIWQFFQAVVPAKDLKAPALTEDGFQAAFPHCWTIVQLEAKEAAIQAESPAPRPEPLPLGTRVIVRSPYERLNGQKGVTSYFSGTHYVVDLTDKEGFADRLLISPNDFEIDQAWAIENEEDAIFGDGQ